MRHTEVAVVSTTLSCYFRSIHREIPQIDVSMHLPNSPGLQQPVFGRRILIAETPKKHSPRTPIDLLFRARTFLEAIYTGDRIQSIKCTLIELRKHFVSTPYPVQIVLLDPLRRPRQSHLYQSGTLYPALRKQTFLDLTIDHGNPHRSLAELLSVDPLYQADF